MMEGRKVTFASRGVERVGYFHKWVTLGDHVYAIVENPDGTVVVVRMQSIRFVINEESTHVSNESE